MLNGIFAMNTIDNFDTCSVHCKVNKWEEQNTPDS